MSTTQSITEKKAELFKIGILLGTVTAGAITYFVTQQSQSRNLSEKAIAIFSVAVGLGTTWLILIKNFVECLNTESSLRGSRAERRRQQRELR